jgi:uncharacterized protein (TIGR01244 family)
MTLPDPEHIYHWRRLDARLTTSGQPSEAELAEIAELGVRCVINIAPHAHAKALADERGTVTRLGMRYVYIPVDFKNPTEMDFIQFSDAMAATQAVPVHVHCAANYRVSAFLYRYRRDVLGMSVAELAADLFEIWQPDAIWTEFLRRETAA